MAPDPTVMAKGRASLLRAHCSGCWRMPPHSLVPTWIATLKHILYLGCYHPSRKSSFFSSRLSANMKEKALAES